MNWNTYMDYNLQKNTKKKLFFVISIKSKTVISKIYLFFCLSIGIEKFYLLQLYINFVFLTEINQNDIYSHIYIYLNSKPHLYSSIGFWKSELSLATSATTHYFYNRASTSRRRWHNNSLTAASDSNRTGKGIEWISQEGIIAGNKAPLVFSYVIDFTTHVVVASNNINLSLKEEGFVADTQLVHRM